MGKRRPVTIRLSEEELGVFDEIAAAVTGRSSAGLTRGDSVRVTRTQVLEWACRLGCELLCKDTGVQPLAPEAAE